MHVNNGPYEPCNCPACQEADRKAREEGKRREDALQKIVGETDFEADRPYNAEEEAAFNEDPQPENESGAFGFSQALELLKNEERLIRRSSWPDEMYLEVENDRDGIPSLTLRFYFQGRTLTFENWTPSQDDIFAENWENEEED